MNPDSKFMPLNFYLTPHPIAIMTRESLSKEMKAVRMHRRGGPENLVFENTNIPVISSGDVLIKVHAASITPTELTWNSSYTDKKGNPRLPVIPSFEVSGTVVSVNENVKNIKTGDEVYGLLDFWNNGCAAEYTVTQASNIALKPVTIDHVSSSSLPLSGLTAWQALFDFGKLDKGKTVLIHGGGGGVGSLAVQLARWKGAHVFATCSKDKEVIVKQLGADQVIDYGKEKFEDKMENLDLIIDTVGGDTLKRSYQILKKGGILVSIAADIHEELAHTYGINAISMLVKPDTEKLKEIALLVDAGEIKPVVQQVFPLRSAKEAYELGLRSHNLGKIVLKVID